MANQNDQAHTSGAVWDRLDTHSSKISELSAAQAATAANLDALARTVQSGFDQINNSFGRIAEDIRRQQERDSKPTNWYAIISGIVLIGGALLAFNALQTDPIRQRTLELASQVDRILQRELIYAEIHGYQRADVDNVSKQMDTFEEWQHETMRQLGRIDEMGRRVEDIDNYGSRRWNDGLPKQ